MKIFFSYAHDKHSEFVRRLANEIEKRSKKSVEVWVDANNIPRDRHWRDAIMEGLEDSNSVIAFLSSHSLRKESVCRDELSIALASKHGIIRTILLEKDLTPPSRVSEYQWGDLSDYPNVQAQGEEAFSAYIEQEANKIIALVNSDEMKQYAKDVQALRKSFHMPLDRDTWTKFDSLIKTELVGREWLFKQVQEWEEDAEGSRILLLCGKPGAGKSMFSAHLQDMDPAVVAAFPCDCRHSAYKTTQSIIMQIAYRLALRLPDYRRVVMNLLKDPKYDLDRDSLFVDLILQPLSDLNIDGNRAVMVIVVDALDEAENDSLADFISRYADSLKKYVRFLVTSRNVPEIVERFSGCKQINIDATNADLAAYYESRLGEKLEGNPEKETFIQQLIKNSDGVFTYAECVTKNILDDIKQGKFTIKDYPVPSNIGDLFRDTLDRSFHRQGSAYSFSSSILSLFCGRNFYREGAVYTEKDYINRWRKPLGMILASPEPLPISTLRSLMNWKDSNLEDFRHPLFSLLTETEGTLTLFHRSFGEWLEQTHTSYAVSKEDGISDLAEACFDIYTDCPDNMDEYMLLYTTQFLRESSDRKHKKYYQRISEDQDYGNRLIDKAETLENRNAFARAMAFYSELLLIYRELKKQYPEKQDYLRNYSLILNKLANIHSDQNKYAEAEEEHTESLLIRRKLAEINPEVYEKDVAESLNNLAILHSDQSKYAEAEKEYTESLSIRRKLAEINPVVYEKDVAESLNNLAILHINQSKYAEAEEEHKESLSIRRKLAEINPEVYEKDVAESLNNLAILHRAQSKYAEAEEEHKESLSIYRKLAKINPEVYEKNVAISLIGMAVLHSEQKKFSEAEKECTESLSIYRKLAEINPVVYEKDVAISLIGIAALHFRHNKISEAEKEYTESLSIYRKLAKINPKVYEKDVARSLIGIAVLHSEQKKFSEAEKEYTESLSIYRKLAKINPKVYEKDVAISLIGIAVLHSEQKKFSEAEKEYTESLSIYRKLADKNHDVYDKYVAIALENLALIHEDQNKYDEAQKEITEALSIYRKLA